MSIQYGKVVSLILLERFGPVVEKVGTYLFQNGTNPLLYIKNSVQLPLSKVKEALCILIKYRLVTFCPNRNENVANYTLDKDAVFLMLRYPKYLNIIKKKFGEECEMVVEELLQKSYQTGSELIVRVIEKLKKDHNKTVSFYKIKEHLVSLITAEYLIRLASPTDDKPVPTLVLNASDSFRFPNIDLSQLGLLQSGQIKSDQLLDCDVYWTVNFQRFHQDLRDKLVVASFAKKFDDNAGEFVRILLQQMMMRTPAWAESSNPVPTVEIRDIVRKQGTHPHLLAFFEQYVDVIEQDVSNLIRKAGDGGGGSLQIFMKEVFIQFAWETIEQMVLEKFDTKAARIFRLVKVKQYIEPDQIQQLAMIPAKETKRLCYKLLEENFFQIQELKKAVSNNGPNKSFNLFHINLTDVVRITLELCYKTLYNVMTKKNVEKSSNERLIYKRDKIDTILMGMKGQESSKEQVAEYEEMITPPETLILEKIDKHLKKLNTAELEVDETIFLLQMYLSYQ